MREIKRQLQFEACAFSSSASTSKIIDVQVCVLCKCRPSRERVERSFILTVRSSQEVHRSYRRQENHSEQQVVFYCLSEGMLGPEGMKCACVCVFVMRGQW